LPRFIERAQHRRATRRGYGRKPLEGGARRRKLLLLLKVIWSLMMSAGHVQALFERRVPKSFERAAPLIKALGLLLRRIQAILETAPG
jgi:hypothetical protein